MIQNKKYINLINKKHNLNIQQSILFISIRWVIVNNILKDKKENFEILSNEKFMEYKNKILPMILHFTKIYVKTQN